MFNLQHMRIDFLGVTRCWDVFKSVYPFTIRLLFMPNLQGKAVNLVHLFGDVT